MLQPPSSRPQGGVTGHEEETMRIYRERIPDVARALVKSLIAEELLEVEAELVEEVELDLESVLKEYRRKDYELGERARDLVSMRGLDYSHMYKLKAQLASKERFGLHEEGIEWIVQQMLEMLLQSNNVEEIYGEDHEIRRTMTPILRRELGMEEGLDREVKRRIKNLKEGTADYDVQYQKTMERLRRNRGLE
jgi:hypothetical protein